MRATGPEALHTATSSPWTSTPSGPTVLSRPFNGRTRVHAKRCCGRRRSPTTCTSATASGRSWFKQCTTRETKRSQHGVQSRVHVDRPVARCWLPSPARFTEPQLAPYEDVAHQRPQDHDRGQPHEGRIEN